MTTDKFQILLNTSERNWVDFKKENYKFNDDDDLAKFVKDIICFSNTIRQETAYILIGVHEEAGKKTLYGIDKIIDDATLQEKVKDKIFPKPHFAFITFEFDKKTYGIIEFPLTSFPEPLQATQKLKGLEPGRIYFRRGSSNQEAIGREIIQISDWLKTLKAEVIPDHKLELYSQLLSKLTIKSVPLSSVLAEGIGVASKFGDTDLITLFINEIEGYNRVSNLNADLLSYRQTSFLVSPYKIQNVRVQTGYTINHMWQELKAKKDFYETTIVIGDSVSHIEQYLSDFEKRGFESFMTLEKKAEDFFGESGELKNTTIYTYSNFAIWNTVYSNIRQHVITEITKKLK
jgi:hypothetical protein